MSECPLIHYSAWLHLRQAHPSTAKEERKSLARLIDARKLTVEAAAHAVQNERMPVHAVVQVLFSEHGKLNRLAELSASFSGQRSPSPSPNPALELPGRCPSKREVLAQHQEVRRLHDDVARLQCNVLQAQVDRLGSERRRRSGGGGGGFFKWSAFWFGGGMGADVGRRLGERHGALDAAQGEEERHGDAQCQVVQVHVLR
uniref:NPH3 domain-containing protein n=1 Tax=Zea mays TaxID=4577 RepID=A0A804PCS7_MAIZE|eukprot:XP_020393585.1 BTB/POZ domain-containing protein NPY5-like [Zea mays]